MHVAKGDWTLGDMSSLLLQMDDRSLVSPLASPSVLPVEGSAREGMLGVLTNEDIGVSREDVPVKPKEPFMAIPAVKGDTSMLPTDGPAPLSIDEGQLDEYASEFDFGEPMERGGGLFEFESTEEAPRPTMNDPEVTAPEAGADSLEGIEPPRNSTAETPIDMISSEASEGVSGVEPRNVEVLAEGVISEPETLAAIETPSVGTPAEAAELEGISGETRAPLGATQPEEIAEESFEDTQPEGISGMEPAAPRERAGSRNAAAFVDTDVDEQFIAEIGEQGGYEQPLSEMRASRGVDIPSELDSDMIEGSMPQTLREESSLGDLLSVLDAPREEPDRRTVSMSGGVPTFDAESLAGMEESVPDDIDGEMRASIESWLGREATPDELRMMMPEAAAAMPMTDYYSLEGIDTPPPTPAPRSEESSPRETSVETETIREAPAETSGESSGTVVEGAVAQEIREKIVRDGGAVNDKLKEQMAKDLEDRIGPLRDEVLQQASETAKGLVEDGIDDFTRGA